VTVFLTTQYLEEADRLAHEVAIMDAGRIVAQGSPEALKASIGTDVVTVRPRGGEEVRERTAAIVAQIEEAEVRDVDQTVMVYVPEGARAIPRIVLALSEADIEVAEITLARPTLDDVFLRKTGHHIEVGAEARPEGRP
jgi:ABC-type multidrug transport system ATPase subunit